VSLARLKAEGWFDEPKQYSFKIKSLTEKDRLALTLNGKVRVASTVDNRVYDLAYNATEETVSINTLPVHTKQTAAMANYTEVAFLKYLQVESVYQETLLVEVIPPPQIPWYKKLWQAWKAKG
jgi:hypothetical protein